MGNRHVILDIHGSAMTFKSLLAKIDLSKNDALYILGGYIDRGLDSKGVIDLILWVRDWYKKVNWNWLGERIHKKKIKPNYNRKQDIN